LSAHALLPPFPSPSSPPSTARRCEAFKAISSAGDGWRGPASTVGCESRVRIWVGLCLGLAPPLVVMDVGMDVLLTVGAGGVSMMRSVLLLTFLPVESTIATETTYFVCGACSAADGWQVRVRVRVRARVRVKAASRVHWHGGMHRLVARGKCNLHSVIVNA
jgi:hypothetical protein